MANLGLSVMINELGGDAESALAMQKAIGKRIRALSIEDNKLLITLDDDSKIALTDEGQSCCEHRYMRTDDDLADFVGATLTGAEVRAAPSLESEYDDHDVEFLLINTDKGDLTISNHNEHNGYYGGFSIRCSVVD